MNKKHLVIASVMICLGVGSSFASVGNYSAETSVVRWMGNIFSSFYTNFVSPVDGARCGFYPTCSQYGKLSVRKYGFIKGCVMACDRLERCHYCAYFGGYTVENGRLKDLPEENNYW